MASVELAVVVYRMAIPTAWVHVRGGGEPHGSIYTVLQHGCMLGVVVYRKAIPTAWVHVSGGGVPHGNTYSMRTC